MFKKEIFASRLKKLRNEHHLSMSALATDIGLKSKGAINQFEKCLNLPSIDTLVAIADYFDVSIDYLLGRTKLFWEPDGLLEYQFINNEGTLQKGIFRYSFGVFPLEHLVSSFLYLEEIEGKFVKEILSSKGQFEFLTLVGLLNEQLYLGYRLDKESNGIHRINLIIKEIDKWNPLPLYKEIKSGTASPVVLDSIFIGYEEFIRYYLNLSTPEKISFLAEWFEKSFVSQEFGDKLKKFLKNNLNIK